MDFYKELKVRNYRSFFAEQLFKPCAPRGTDGDILSGYNVVVGPNNSGKSSLMYLLGSLRWTSLSDDDFNSATAKISIKTTNNNRIIASYNLRAAPRMETSPQDGHQPNLSVFYVNPNRNIEFISGGQIGNSYGRNGTDIKPNYLNVLRGMSAAQIDSQPLRFIEVLGEIYEANLSDEFCSLVREFVPDFGTYTIRFRNNQSSVEYSDISGRIIDPKFLSDGTKALLFLIALAFYFRVEGDPNTIPLPSVIVIDEPERSLQPDAQRKMHKLLIEISKHIQIIVSTHSPYFVSWLDIFEGATIHRIYRDDGGKSRIKKLGIEEWQADSDFQAAINSSPHPRRLHHYDLLSREALFANSCLLVEGQEDALIVRKFIEEQKLDLNYQVFGYGADGAGNIKGWIKILTSLGIGAAALLDGDATGAAEAKRAKALLGKNSVQQISTEDIRDKPALVPAAAKTGIADIKGVVKVDEIEPLKLLLKGIKPA